MLLFRVASVDLFELLIIFEVFISGFRVRDKRFSRTSVRAEAARPRLRIANAAVPNRLFYTAPHRAAAAPVRNGVGNLSTAYTGFQCNPALRMF